MFRRPACLQGRRPRNRAAEEWSTFPIRQLFVLGKCGTFDARIAIYAAVFEEDQEKTMKKEEDKWNNEFYN
jgi:hypothetical protein